MNENQNYANPPQQTVQVIYQQQTYAPVRQLNTNRGLLKFILLSIITLGIYGLVVMSSVGEDSRQHRTISGFAFAVSSLVLFPSYCTNFA